MIDSSSTVNHADFFQEATDGFHVPFAIDPDVAKTMRAFYQTLSERSGRSSTT